MTAGYHPCGAVQDFIRTAYVGRMRTVQGAPPADVTWFFVPRDTPHAPDNVYQSLDSDQPYANDGIGEQRERAHAGRYNKCAPYLDGAQPYPLDGLHQCGDEHARLYGARPGIDHTFTTDCIGRCPDCTPPLFVGCIESGSREGGPVEHFPAIVGVLASGSREGGRIRSGFVLFSCLPSGDGEGGPLASSPVPIHLVESGSREGGPVERIPPHPVLSGSREGDALARRSPWRLASGSREGDALLVAAVARWIGGGSSEGGPLDGDLDPAHEVEAGSREGGPVDGRKGPTPTDTSCFRCSVTFHVWQYTASGGTGDFAVCNGTHDLPAYTPCQWFTDEGTFTALLDFSPSGDAQFNLSPNVPGSGSLYAVPRNCTGSMTFSLVSFTGTGTPPATVQVDPVS